MLSPSLAFCSLWTSFEVGGGRLEAQSQPSLLQLLDCSPEAWSGVRGWAQSMQEVCLREKKALAPLPVWPWTALPTALLPHYLSPGHSDPQTPLGIPRLFRSQHLQLGLGSYRHWEPAG